jgi:hypothetical protein
MLAAPALNPAVLAVTFLVFSPVVAWTRLAVSVALVLAGAAVLGRAFRDPRPPEPCPIDAEPPTWRGLVRAFGASLRSVAARSLPAILLGVVASAALAGIVPLDHLAGAGPVVIALVALVAVPLALPTFGEIPLALALLAAGAPLGAAVALLIAGPAINLPSLLTLARVTSWRVAAALAATVFVAALVSGLAVSAL